MDHNGGLDRDHDTSRRRRSSLAERFNFIRHAGGPNSIDNFVSSFQRAGAFHEITPARRGSSTRPWANEGRERSTDRGNRVLSQSPTSAVSDESLLEFWPDSTGFVVQDTVPPSDMGETTSLLPTLSNVSTRLSLPQRTRMSSSDLLGLSYGSISSYLSDNVRRRAIVLIDDYVESNQRKQDSSNEYGEQIQDRRIEIEPQTEEDPKIRIVGGSTLPMTVFNSINIMLGVGILSLPLAVSYLGWILSLITLLSVAMVTEYTAKLLAKCLDTNPISQTYGDLAYMAFDVWGRRLVEIVFVLELTAANVALIILFGDSIHLLLSDISVTDAKIIIAAGLIPLNFVPLKYLSVTSVLGICSMLGIVMLIFTDGLIKPTYPGSLRDLAPTHILPYNIKVLPIGIALFMAPLGGHSVFPAVYKDMRHPYKYHRALRVTFSFIIGLNLAMMALGYFMFGDLVDEEVTANILKSDAYPQIISIILLTLVVVVPVTKMPLSIRPIMDTMNQKFSIDLRQMDEKAREASEKSLIHRSGRFTIAVAVNLFQLFVSIAFPDFDLIMAIMGSAFCFSICIILPISFYLKMFWNSSEITLTERSICFALLAVSVVLGVAGTVVACLPKKLVGL